MWNFILMMTNKSPLWNALKYSMDAVYDEIEDEKENE